MIHPGLTSARPSLGSDNHSGIHPNIWQALASVNHSHTASYGTDPVTQEALKCFQYHFGEPSKSFFVFNGTAANVLSIKALIESHNSVLCSDTSHLWIDECGAPEHSIGCKIIPLSSSNGKINTQTLRQQMIRLGDQHYAQPKLVSITQPTELGTLYSYQEMKDIAQFCKDHNLFLHIDGARFIYTPQLLNKNFKELTLDLGVDALSFGGTKNGLLFGEAVVLFRPETHQKFKYIRKQNLQLPSKMRFIAAQFLELLKETSSQALWQEIAQHGHSMAKKLEKLILDIPELKITQSVEANSVFVQVPRPWVKPLKKESFFYIWNEDSLEARWMTSFDTKESDLKKFVDFIKVLRQQHPLSSKELS